MEYASFEEIDLPAGAVTELNPAHRMDFRRFASDQVARFNRLQADIIRARSPGRDIIHNFMGRTLSFDHFDVGSQLDVSSWDAYPLGFLDSRADRGEEWRRRFARAGDPDFQAFHHDLYRATSGGRWWVMEQQPGPVNWAHHNPTPRAGMVRLWTWEAFAHGAETVSYFRWRQAPFAQEQMHAGLLRPDSVEAEGFAEARQVAKEITAFDLPPAGPSEVAIVFDYASAWAWEIQPQGKEFDYFRLVFDFYRSLRQLGLSIDIVPATASDLSNYKLVIAPGLFAWTEALRKALAEYDGVALVGPRSGSKTADFSIPRPMPPDLPERLRGLVVSRVETLRADVPVAVEGGGAVQFWREFVECGKAEALIASQDAWPVLVREGVLHYLAGWPDESLMQRVLERLAADAGIAARPLPEGVRIRRDGKHLFAVNYGDQPCDLARFGIDGKVLLGEPLLAPSGVAIFKIG
jgi:beta-galactosidase